MGGPTAGGRLYPISPRLFTAAGHLLSACSRWEAAHADHPPRRRSASTRPSALLYRRRGPERQTGSMGPPGGASAYEVRQRRKEKLLTTLSKLDDRDTQAGAVAEIADIVRVGTGRRCPNRAGQSRAGCASRDGWGE